MQWITSAACWSEPRGDVSRGPVFALAVAMRVLVSSPGEPLDSQLLTYAEYRIFAALAGQRGIRSARVSLHRKAGSPVRCSVRITLEPGGSARASASGSHPAAAIDRAASRITRLMRARVSS